MISEKMQEQRLSAWEETLAHFRRVVDGVGCSIDPGILETVVALNLLSISTTASCEGHLDEPGTHPWVDLGVIDEEIGSMTRQAYRLNYEASYLPPQEINKTTIDLMQQIEALRQKVRPRHQAIARRLLPYLEAFYREQTSSEECRLIIQSGHYMGKCRLQSQGAFLLADALLNKEEQIQLLHAFQEEMRAFTAFLKRLYLKGLHLRLEEQK